MSLSTPPWLLSANGILHPSEVGRRAISSFVNPIGGVTGPTELAVTQSVTPAMSVLVAAGEIWVPGTTSASQGMYYGYSDAGTSLAIGASDLTNPRIDLVIAQVRDSVYAGSSDDMRLTVLQGTPASSPLAPTVPDSTLVLAQIAVAANASSIVNANITDKRVFAESGLLITADRIKTTSGIQYGTNATQTLSTTLVDVTGCVVNPITTAIANTKLRVRGGFTFDLSNVAAVAICNGSCAIDGTNQTQQVEAYLQGPSGIEARWMCVMEWMATLASVGTHTTQLRVNASFTGSAAATLIGTQSWISWELLGV